MEAKFEQEITVDGMTCGHCVQALMAALVAIDGVRTANIDVETGRLILHVEQPIAVDQIGNVLTDTDFELTAIRERVR